MAQDIALAMIGVHTAMAEEERSKSLISYILNLEYLREHLSHILDLSIIFSKTTEKKLVLPLLLGFSSVSKLPYLALYLFLLPK